MSLRELARRSDVSYSSIHEIETGAQLNPGIQSVLKLGEALNVIFIADWSIEK